MKTLLKIKGTRVSQYSVCQERPGYGLIWVRSIDGREIERSQGCFYPDMGGHWHPNPIVACVQGIRAKCSRVRNLLKGTMS